MQYQDFKGDKKNKPLWEGFVFLFAHEKILARSFEKYTKHKHTTNIGPFGFRNNTRINAIFYRWIYLQALRELHC